MRKFISLGAAIGLLVLPGAALAQVTTTTYGDTQVVNTGPASDPSVFQLTSNTSGSGYAGLEFHFTTPITLGSITTLSSDYQMTTGAIGGGAPRFTIFDGSLNSAFVYFGTPTGGDNFTDPNAGAFGNTGNYADLASTDARVASDGFGGFNSGFPSITWADFVAHVGSMAVSYVTLDLDAGAFTSLPEGQQMLADNFTVNGNVLSATGGVPEPATWGLMILGLGGAGAALRRRRATVVAQAA